MVPWLHSRPTVIPSVSVRCDGNFFCMLCWIAHASCDCHCETSMMRLDRRPGLANLTFDWLNDYSQISVKRLYWQLATHHGPVQYIWLESVEWNWKTNTNRNTLGLVLLNASMHQTMPWHSAQALSRLGRLDISMVSNEKSAVNSRFFNGSWWPSL
jgi:hypothetical protein